MRPPAIADVPAIRFHLAMAIEYGHVRNWWNERVTRMPKPPLKVKIFMDSKASIIEEQINAWLEGSPSIVKIETVVTAIAQKPDDGTYPCIVVTIWYEPSN